MVLALQVLELRSCAEAQEFKAKFEESQDINGKLITAPAVAKVCIFVCWCRCVRVRVRMCVRACACVCACARAG
jgi:hypothetical protein